jgi:uncharacterized membrane protein YkvA (DUF1232 family)
LAATNYLIADNADRFSSIIAIGDDMTIQNRKSPGFWAELIKSFRLAWRLIRDQRVPWLIKLIPLIVLIYIVSPIDIIPDFILGIGQLDDLAVLILGVQVFIAVSPRAIVQQHRDELDGIHRGDGGSSASGEIINGK